MGARARRRSLRVGVLLACAASAAVSAVAAVPVVASPVSGPHERIDNRLTTTQPGAPSGFGFDGQYHAAGDPNGYPPFMRKMVFYNTSGMRYDTSVPDRCSASDLELEVLGPAACPAGSRLGGGTTTTSFPGGAPTTVSADFFNNADEQIILARSPVLSTVARGKILPDGSVEFASPTCYPYLEPPGCPLDTVLQLRSSLTVAPYTRALNGLVRSYITTPATCPPVGYWQSPVRLWWADGSVDTVITQNPCAATSLHAAARAEHPWARGKPGRQRRLADKGRIRHRKR